MEGISGLRTRKLGRHNTHFETVGSTNDYLKAHAGQLCQGASVTASLQTAGKGRMGRSWQNIPDTSLALSVLLEGYAPKELTVLPLLAGLAVSKALEALTDRSFGLKWCNDVLFEGRKLCGILCESRIASDRVLTIVGLGVNVTQTQEQLDCLNLEYATSLYLATKKFMEIDRIGGEILSQLEEILDLYATDGFLPLKKDYIQRCVTLGQTVRVVEGDREWVGQAVDLADNGALVCLEDGKHRLVHGGEASVRGLYGYV